MEEILHSECGEALPQVVQRSCRWSIMGSVQSENVSLSYQ